ncbi:TPA: hypothetical protein P6L71_000768 [Staphylococcus aureus]|nr:hypothetical protein [Staphylococcus aureus]
MKKKYILIIVVVIIIGLVVIAYAHNKQIKDHKNELKSTDIIKKEHLDKSDYEADPPLFFFSGRLE